MYNEYMSKMKGKNNLSLEERKIINSFFKTKNFEILERSFNKSFGTIKYVVEEKENEIDSEKEDEKELMKLHENESIYNIEKIRLDNNGFVVKSKIKKVRFIIVQSLNVLNQKVEFKKKRVSKNFLKERNIIKNIFNYIVANNIKDEVSLDMLQIYINGETRKIKYRKNIANIKNFPKIDPLRNAA